MEFVIATCLGWVITTCLLVWFLVKRDQAERNEREELRVEIRVAQTELTSLARSHAEQLERISEAHRKEVGNLCQRIQAPEIAVGEHLSQNAGPDPAPVDLENDLALVEAKRRELEQFAEELSVHVPADFMDNH